MLLLDSGRKSLTQGALATAEATLERARALAGVHAERQAQIDEVLLQVLSDAGKHERVFEVGDTLLAALATSSAPPLRCADVHLSIARAAVAGSRFPEALRHLEHARRLDTDGVLEARLDAQAAHVAMEERRVSEAERLAQAALASAERLGQPEVACEALLVIGRLARAHHLDRAEEAFARAQTLAEAHSLPIWRGRALHELGTIDMFRDASPRRLLEARALAIGSGALITAAWVDGELAALLNMRFELGLSLEAANRALEAGRRFRLRGVEAMALLFVAETAAYQQDRSLLTTTLADLDRVGGRDGFVGLVACECRAIAALLDEDRPAATRELETGMGFARQLPVAAPAPSFGLWALLRTLDTPDGARRATICARRGLWRIPPTAASWRMRKRLTWVATGRPSRRPERSPTAIARWRSGRGTSTTATAWWRKRRFGTAGGAGGLAARGRGLLRRRTDIGRWRRRVDRCCANAARRDVRAGASGRSGAVSGHGVTEREMEVLTILADGLSNKAIGARLYLSPKTVEKHVASLMDKLDVRTRSQLRDDRHRHSMGDGAATRWGKSTS